MGCLVMQKTEQYKARLQEATNKVYLLETQLKEMQKQQKTQYIRRVNDELKEKDWRKFRKQIDAVTSRNNRDTTQKEAFVKRIKTDLDEIFVRYPKKQNLRDGFELMFDDNVEKQLFQFRNAESDHEEALTKQTAARSQRDCLRTVAAGESTATNDTTKVKVKQVCVGEQAESSDRKMFAFSRDHVRASSRHSSKINQYVPTYRTASKTASPAYRSTSKTTVEQRRSSKTTSPVSVDEQRSVHVDSVLCHDSRRKYRETIQLSEDCMTIGSQTFRFSDIHSLRIGDASMFEGNPDPDCCLTIVSAKGTVMIEAASKQKRDFWFNAIKTLSISFAKRDRHKQGINEQMRKGYGCSSERTFESESSKPSMTRFREATKNHIQQHTRMRDDAQHY